MPAIRRALFNNISASKELGHRASDQELKERLKVLKSREEFLSFVNANLNSYEDGLRLCLAAPKLIQVFKRCRHQSTAIEALHDINTFVSRLELVGVTPPRQILRFGMTEAARRGLPVAVMAYIRKLRSMRDEDHFVQLPIRSVITAFVNEVNHRGSFKGPNSEAKRQEWLHIIELILSEWIQDEMKKASDYHSVNLIFNSFIQAFSILGDAKRAWDVAKGFDHRFGPIHSEMWELLEQTPEYLGDWLPGLVRRYENQFMTMQNTTLNLLFSHPELIKNWTSDLTEPAKVELERQLEEIEDLLGFRWRAGEDGFHVRPYWA